MPHAIVIFGASGDLTSRKLIPAIYELFRKKRLPDDTRIIGFSRTPFEHDAWRAKLAESTAGFVGKAFDTERWNQFAANVFYHRGDIENPADFQSLRAFLEQLEGETAKTTRVFYLSTAPAFYEPAIERLGAAELADESRGPVRLVIEKPFGTDLATARALNEFVHRVFREEQVYRIDHYLGKETGANHRGGRGGRGAAGGVLRFGRHSPRHVPESPTPIDHLDRN